MKNYICYSLLLGLQISMSTLACHASEVNCVTAYEKSVSYAEVASEAATAKDACRAASGIEMALNWTGTAESECAYDSSKLYAVKEFKKQLTPLLIKYVKLCGH